MGSMKSIIGKKILENSQKHFGQIFEHIWLRPTMVHDVYVKLEEDDSIQELHWDFSVKYENLLSYKKKINCIKSIDLMT